MLGDSRSRQAARISRSAVKGDRSAWRKHRETVGVSDDALQTVLGKDDCETEVFVETISARALPPHPTDRAGCRLVEGQDRGLQSKGGGDRHALPLPTRERRNLAISQCGDPQQIEHLLDPLAHRHRGHTELLHPEGELVVDAAGHELGLWILETNPVRRARTRGL